MQLCDMTVTAYLAQLGSDAPAPGGGSASALCGAQGAALAAMVAALTLGKKKYEADHPLCLEVQAAALDLKARLEAQIDADTAAFNQVSAAFKLAKETEEQKAARSAAIQAATLAATQVPYDTLGLALEALEQAGRLVGHSNPNTASDLGVAALNLLACAKGAWLNVRINLGSLKDTAAVDAFSSAGGQKVERAQALADALYAGVLNTL